VRLGAFCMSRGVPVTILHEAHACGFFILPHGPMGLYSCNTLILFVFLEMRRCHRIEICGLTGAGQGPKSRSTDGVRCLRL
jgi:hypothetical protein